MRHLLIFIGAVIFFVGHVPANAFALEENSKVSDEARSGRLANGFSYVIHRQKTLVNKVDIRLVLRVGTDQEELGEREYAHLVEHLVANHSFIAGAPSVWKWVPSWGGVIGRDFNATTKSDRVNYKLSIPSDRPEILRDALLRQRGWAQGAAFSDDDIAREQKAVVNEMARGMDWTKRVSDRLENIIVGSDPRLDVSFENRARAMLSVDPIKLRRFHRKWYRPDLQTLIIVGDVDPNEMASQITELFGDLKPSPDAAQPVVIQSDINPGNQYYVISDPDATEVQLNIVDKRRIPGEAPAMTGRNDLIGRLVSSMIYQREQRLLLGPGSAMPVSTIINNGTKAGSARAGISHFTTSVAVYPAMLGEALHQIFSVRRSIEAYGFLEAEWETAREQALHDLQFAGSPPSNEQLVEEYEESFVSGRPLSSDAEERLRLRKMLESLSLSDVNEWARVSMTTGARDIVLAAPDRSIGALPTDSIIEKWVKANEDLPPKRYILPREISSIVPKSHGIYKGVPVITDFAAMGVRRLVIPENGVTILLRPDVNAPANMIQLSAVREGGTDQFIGVDNLNARASGLAVAWDIGGVDPFEQSLLRSKGDIWISGSVSDDKVELLGGARPEHFERFLKLYRAAFTPGAKNRRAFENWRKKMTFFYEAKSLSPQERLTNRLDEINPSSASHRMKIGPETISKIDYDAARNHYREFYGRPKEFIFIVEGDFDPDVIGPMVVRSLGTLPKSKPGHANKRIPLQNRLAQSVRVYAGNDSKAAVVLSFAGQDKIAFSDRAVVRALDNILKLRLRDRLREKERGTYAVTVFTSLDNGFNTTISFDCEPGSVDQLIAAAVGEVDRLQRGEISPVEIDDLKKLEEAFQRARGRGVRYWKTYLSERYFEANRNDRAFDIVPENVPTAAAVQGAARNLLAINGLSRIILLPERLNPSGEKSD